jgi:uncharacterized Zn-binding protein involved in type VI secretion
MAELWAVAGDPDSHGGGALNADIGGTVFINGKAAIVVGDSAGADSLCVPDGGAHCAPSATSGSGTVFCYGLAVHRNGDSRACGATTTVVGESTVFVG